MNPARLLAALAGAFGAAGAGLYFLRDQTTDSDETGEEILAPVEVPRGRPEIGLRAVEVLTRYVGEKGQGKKGTSGYHRSPTIDRINLGVYGDGKGLLGAPWCARAVRYAYEVAAQELGLPPPFAKITSDLASISKWKKYLGTSKISSPKVGAALLLGDTHATLIARVVDARTVVCVEGNHSDSVANVRRTIGPKDTIIDVEAHVVGRPDLVGLSGLESFG